MVRSKLRSPASTCATGIPSFAATSAAATVEFTSPGTTTRSGRSPSSRAALEGDHHPAGLLAVRAGADRRGPRRGAAAPAPRRTRRSSARRSAGRCAPAAVAAPRRRERRHERGDLHEVRAGAHHVEDRDHASETWRRRSPLPTPGPGASPGARGVAGDRRRPVGHSGLSFGARGARRPPRALRGGFAANAVASAEPGPASAMTAPTEASSRRPGGGPPPRAWGSRSASSPALGEWFRDAAASACRARRAPPGKSVPVRSVAARH